MDFFRRIPASGFLMVAVVAALLVAGFGYYSGAWGATEAVVVDPAALPENQPSVVDSFLSPALLDRVQALLFDILLGLGMGVVYAVYAWLMGKKALSEEDKKDIILERIRDFARRGLELEADLVRKRLGLPPSSILGHEHDDEIMVGAVNYVAKAGAESLSNLGIKVKESALSKGAVVIEEGGAALTNLVRATRAIMKNEDMEKAVATEAGSPLPPKLVGRKIRPR